MPLQRGALERLALFQLIRQRVAGYPPPENGDVWTDKLPAELDESGSLVVGGTKVRSEEIDPPVGPSCFGDDDGKFLDEGS